MHWNFIVFKDREKIVKNTISTINTTSFNSKKILINALSASGQVVITGIVYLFLYHYLLKTLGAEQLGIWALLLATISIANLANFGITSGLVKFVADYTASGRSNSIDKLIFTAFISIAVLFLILIIIIFISSKYILSKIIDPTHISLALKILPYSLLCLFINALGGVFTSVLEGFQKNYIRNIIYTFSSIFFLLLCYLLVPYYQLMGVAYAQIIQSLLILIISFVASKRLYITTKIFVWKWEGKIFNDLFSYGSKFQAISICVMLCEPTTKVLLTNFGGLAMVGYYEMASRLISQFRALIINANQVIVPVIAAANHESKFNVEKIYSKSFVLIHFISMPLIIGIIIFATSISFFWLGHIEFFFITSLWLLSGCTYLNIMCGPAYFNALGEGKLRNVLLVHIIITISNLGLSFLLGSLFQSIGVIIGWVISLSIGSVLLIYLHHKKNHIPIATFFNMKEKLFSVIGLFIGLFAILWFYLKGQVIFSYSTSIMEAIVFTLFVICIIRYCGIFKALYSTFNMKEILQLKKK